MVLDNGADAVASSFISPCRRTIRPAVVQISTQRPELLGWQPRGPPVGRSSRHRRLVCQVEPEACPPEEARVPLCAAGCRLETDASGRCKDARERRTSGGSSPNLGPWFHNLDIHGVRTAPDHFLGRLSIVSSGRASSKSFRRISQDAVFWMSDATPASTAFEMKRRNAGRVFGIDADSHAICGRHALRPSSRASTSSFRQMSVYDVGKLQEKFDLVIFMGVLYHLRHPLLALDLLYEHVVKGSDVVSVPAARDERLPELQENYDFSEWSLFDRHDYPEALLCRRAVCVRSYQLVHSQPVGSAGDAAQCWFRRSKQVRSARSICVVAVSGIMPSKCRLKSAERAALRPPAD
jgi:tRNA (mo5U34)-methyltransferase